MEILDALQRYETQLRADGRSEHTIKQHFRFGRLFASWCAQNGPGCELSQIGHEDVARFLSSPEATTRPDGRRKKATAMNAMRSSLKTFLQYGHRAGYVPKDPGRLIKRALCGTPPPRVLPEAELARLLDMLKATTSPASKRDYALIHLLAATGIRVGSAIGLNVEDLDLANAEIWLHVTKGDRPDKVFLHEKIRGHLQAFSAGRTQGPLFTAKDGKRISTRHFQRRFAAWLKKAGVRRQASCHSLRHSYAVSLYNRCHDLALVQQALNHRSIASTLVYARCDENRLRQVVSGI